MITYALAGLPGAGKTTVAEMGEHIFEGDVVYVGDEIRERAAIEYGHTPTSEEIAQFAADERKRLGDGFGMDIVLEKLADGNYSEPLFIDSVRHIDGYRKLVDASGIEPYLVWVAADNHDLRLERLQQRDRDGEGDFGIADLLSRDHKELTELGQQTLLDSGEIDFRLVNDGLMAKLEKRLRGLVKETYYD